MQFAFALKIKFFVVKSDGTEGVKDEGTAVGRGLLLSLLYGIAAAQQNTPIRSDRGKLVV